MLENEIKKEEKIDAGCKICNDSEITRAHDAFLEEISTQSKIELRDIRVASENHGLLPDKDFIKKYIGCEANIVANGKIFRITYQTCKDSVDIANFLHGKSPSISLSRKQDIANKWISLSPDEIPGYFL